METKSTMDGNRPTRRIKGLVTRLFPAAFRGDLESDLFEGFRSWPEFIPKTLAAMVIAHSVQVLNSLNLTIIAAETALLVACFASAPLSLANAAFILIPLIGLTLRDAHVALKANPYTRTAADAAVLAIMLFLTQALVLLARSEGAPATGLLFRISVILLPLFSTLRLIVHAGPSLLQPTKGPLGSAQHAYLIAWVLLMTWAAASIGAIIFTWQNLPGTYAYRFLYIFFPPPTLALAYRMQQDTILRVPALEHISIVEPRSKASKAKANRLWKVEVESEGKGEANRNFSPS